MYDIGTIISVQSNYGSFKEFDEYQKYFNMGYSDGYSGTDGYLKIFDFTQDQRNFYVSGKISGEFCKVLDQKNKIFI